MALTTEHLHTASELVSAAASLREAASQWRERFPAIRTVLVDALDMRDETPALTLGARKVYMAASNGHCWSVTQEAAQASALILTQD